MIPDYKTGRRSAGQRWLVPLIGVLLVLGGIAASDEVRAQQAATAAGPLPSPLVGANDLDREEAPLAKLYVEDFEHRLPAFWQRWTFGELRGGDLNIDGMANQMTIGFGSRMDQVVERGRLNLNFSYSPTLVQNASQLRIRLNGETLRSIRLDADAADERHSYTIDLPARYFDRYNELEFELMAEAMGAECPVVSPAAWLEFQRDSSIELERRQLSLADELAFFPEPFLDVRDFRQATVHYALPEEADYQFTAAAGMLSSYFGQQAAWRGVRTELYRYLTEWPDTTTDTLAQEPELLPELVGDWPARHSVVFVTNEQRPWFFRDLPEVAEPQVRMMTNPGHEAYQLLVVQAPEPAGLVQAIRGLISHPTGLSGDTAQVRARAPEPRAAYSAPRWLPTDREVSFSELVEFPTDLQRTGYRNQPINVELRLPPDLFTWQQRGIPIDLGFRYTPPIELDESRLRVYINNEFLRGYTLTKDGVGGASERIRIPLLDTNPFTQPALEIPAFKLGAINQLSFEFSFSARTRECLVRPIGNTEGAIDGDSTLDLRGYGHYTALPDLQLFARTGYPFSRYDDLSSTLVVLPAVPSDNELKTAYQVLAQMGANTGYYASLLRFKTVAEVPDDAREDILIIGQQAFADWLDRFGRRTLDRQLRDHGLAGERDLFMSADEQVSVSGPRAALVSYESPLQSKATVVAITANTDEYLREIPQLLRSSRADDMRGFLTMVTPGEDRHLESYEPYYVGNLSFTQRMYYHLSRYPVLVAVLTMLAVITLVLVLYWFFAGLARRRTEQTS